MRQAHNPALDGLRGLAVLTVFLSHAANDGFIAPLFGQGAGQMGVQLFFMLSGYLMMTLYGGQRPDAATLRRFAAARAGRVVPLYWLVLGLSAAAGWAGLAPYYRVADGAVLLPAAAFGAAPQELWSIPVEIQFYVLFALLWSAGATRRPRLWLGLAGASFLAAALWRGWVSEAMILLPYLPVFLIGCALAYLPEAARRTLGGPALAWAALAMFALNLPGLRGALGLEIWSGFFPRFWLDPLRLFAAMALLAVAAAGARSWLCLPWLRALGQISFCVYLVHRPVLAAVAALGLAPTPVSAALALAVSVAIGWVSLRVYERPAAALVRRLGQPTRPALQSERG